MSAVLENIESLTKEGYTVLISQKYNDTDDYYYYVVSISDSDNKVISVGEGTLLDAMTDAYCGTPEK